jgi:hypothetical protein
MTVSFGRASATRARLAICTVAGAALLAACTSTASPAASAAPLTSAVTSSAPSAEPSATPAEASSASGPETSQPTGVPTAVDPCTLVTSDEVSTLAGVSLGTGKPSTTQGNGKVCTYGQEGAVFEVIVGQAPDVATAQAGEKAAEAAFQKAAANGLKVTELKGFDNGAADAATLEGSQTIGGGMFSASGIYVLKGTIYFAITDVSIGHAATTTDALQAQAITSIGRLP